jgi:methylated-DNA-[protein]-cysteine S-methyltransferase
VEGDSGGFEESKSISGSRPGRPFSRGYEARSRGRTTGPRKAFGRGAEKPILAPMKISAARIESPLGVLVAEFSAQGALRRLDFLDGDFADHLAQRSAALGLELREDPRAGVALERELAEYFDGTRRAFDHPLELEGTDFQRAVWKELLAIPYGAVISYSQLAERLGKPGASRAVGSANGANPVPLLVPCHRVIAAGGGLGGYSGGLDKKRTLLELEGALEPLFAGAAR